MENALGGEVAVNLHAARCRPMESKNGPRALSRPAGRVQHLKLFPHAAVRCRAPVLASACEAPAVPRRAFAAARAKPSKVLNFPDSSGASPAICSNRVFMARMLPCTSKRSTPSSSHSMTFCNSISACPGDSWATNGSSKIAAGFLCADAMKDNRTATPFCNSARAGSGGHRASLLRDQVRTQPSLDLCLFVRTEHLRQG